VKGGASWVRGAAAVEPLTGEFMEAEDWSGTRGREEDEVDDDNDSEFEAWG